MGAGRSGMRHCHLSLHRGGYRGHRHGQILIVTLISLVLLVGLIFYVYNLGDQVNRRLEMQNAADAAAISGAGWMARSMNLIAMNNVTISRMVALAIVLDSLPLAAEMTVAEMEGDDSLPIPLQSQLNAGQLSNVSHTRTSPRSRDINDDFLKAGLAKILELMPEHRNLIDQIDQALAHSDERVIDGGFSVGDATDAPDGSIWQIIGAMDVLSDAAYESAGSLAQSNAFRFGQANNAATALLAPLIPEIPAVKGEFFDDFKTVFTSHVSYSNDPRYPLQGPQYSVQTTDIVSRLAFAKDVAQEIERIGNSWWGTPDLIIRGGAIPDFDPNNPHRFGPFASPNVYRWRDDHRPGVEDYGYTSFDTVTTGYNSYGPLEHSLRTVLGGLGQMGAAASAGGIAYTTRFPHHVRKIAKMKLAYLLSMDPNLSVDFGSPQPVQYSDRWITNFDEARRFASDNPDLAYRVRYYHVRVESEVKWDTGGWLTTAQFHSNQLNAPLSRPIEEQPLWNWAEDRLLEDGEWWEPGGGYVKEGNHVWVRAREWHPRFYQPFNWLARPLLDADGNQMFDAKGSPMYDPYTLYSVDWYVWGGLEVRDEVMIHDPFEGAYLPGPYLLDTTSESEPNDVYLPDGGMAVRVAPFEFLGVAMRGQVARQMPARFASHNPAGQTVTVAQVKLFNNSSWDLWTQDWQVQLAPVSDWDGWVAELSNPINPDVSAGPTQDDVDRAMQYLEGLAPMAEEFSNH